MQSPPLFDDPSLRVPEGVSKHEAVNKPEEKFPSPQRESRKRPHQGSTDKKASKKYNKHTNYISLIEVRT